MFPVQARDLDFWWGLSSLQVKIICSELVGAVFVAIHVSPVFTRYLVTKIL